MKQIAIYTTKMNNYYTIKTYILHDTDMKIFYTVY